MSFRYANLWVNVFFRLVFVFVVLCALGGFELFKEEGARAQGLDNSVEAEGVLRYINHLMVFLVSLAVILFFFDKGFKLPRGILTNPAWGFFALLVCSVVWHFFEGTEYAFGIFRSAVPIMFSMILLMLIPWVVSWPVLLKDMQVLFFFCLLLSIFLAVFIPSYGVDVEGRGWQGMFNHKNQLGVFCVVVSCVSLIAFDRSPVLSRVNFVFSAFLVVASGSYTAIGVVVLILFGSIVPGFIRGWVLRARFVFFALLLGVGGGVVAISVLGASGNFNIFGKDMSFSGRDKVWSYAIDGAQDSFFGHGLNSIALQNELDSGYFERATGQVLASAHNGFISLYYDFGIPGFFVFFVFLFFLLSRIGLNLDWGYSYFIFVCAAMVSNFFESRLLGFNAFFVLLVLLFSSLGVLNCRGSAVSR